MSRSPESSPASSWPASSGWRCSWLSVSATETELHIRNLFESVQIPLASVDTVVVRRYLLVCSGGQRYIRPAISRPLRKTVRNEMKWSGQQPMGPGVSAERLGALQTDVKDQPELAYPDFVEQRIIALAASDRRPPPASKSDPRRKNQLWSQVVRRIAWAEVVALVVLAVGFVVTLAVIDRRQRPAALDACGELDAVAQRIEPRGGRDAGGVDARVGVHRHHYSSREHFSFGSVPLGRTTTRAPSRRR